MGATYCCKPSNSKEEKTNEVNSERKMNNDFKLLTEVNNMESQKHENKNTQEFIKKSLYELREFPEQNNCPDEIRWVADKALVLNIEIISTPTEPKGELIQINPFGWVNSPRNAKDGFVYFGYDPGQTDNIFDYIIVPKDENRDDRFIGKHFQIQFNPSDLNYYLKDLGHGFGTFFKLDTWTEIKNNTWINIGSNYWVFTLGLTDNTLMSEYNPELSQNANGKILNIKIWTDEKGFDEFTFNPSKSPITIGRNMNCTIQIEDYILSRIQSTIEYRNGQWNIQDGSIINNSTKHSTNGTWMLAFSDKQITDKMIFKGNHKMFLCSLSDNNLMN